MLAKEVEFCKEIVLWSGAREMDVQGARAL